jgi:hypothetical protein
MRHILAKCCGPLVALLVVGSGARAWAIDEEVLLTTAEQACLSGGYQRGVEILANLYLATRKPAYLHNQARCYEQNGQNEAAIGRYNEFLRQAKNLPVEKKAEIEANIIRLEQKIARQRAVEGQAPYYGQQPPAYGAPQAGAGPPQGQAPGTYQGYQPPMTPTAVPPVAAQVTPSTPTASTSATPTVTASAKADSGNLGLRIAGITAVAAGGGALLVGVLSGLSASDTQKKVEDDVKTSNVYDEKRFKDGKDSAKLATIGFIAAPVLLGAGALMYWLGMPSATEKSAFTVMPSVAFGDRGARVDFALTY